MEFFEVTLPTGFAAGRKWYRNAVLRPLSGTEEESVRASADVGSLAERITDLLKDCLIALGPGTAVTRDSVRALTVGDREALLLHLRRITFGNKITAGLSCPRESCGEKMEIGLHIDNLLTPPNEYARGLHETLISDNGIAYRVVFRLPTGADQEEAARLALRNPKAASALIIGRCIQKIERGDAGTKYNKPPEIVAERLPGIMGELDPQADVSLNMICPLCTYNFTTSFDFGAYFIQEIIDHSQQLYQDVHALALCYHWSEREILGMSCIKRKIYLNLLSDALYSGKKQ